MSTPEAELKRVHKDSTRNRADVEKSDYCGCFCCIRVFTPSKITEWIKEGRKGTAPGETAICPFCGIDSVLGDVNNSLDPAFLQDMRAYWFDRTAPLSDAFKENDARDD